jgi:para-aminobenzoate synthetase/4-amino-4-deoxychorismate lyase
MTGSVIAQDEAGGWLLFADPVRVLLARTIHEVSGVLEQAAHAVAAGSCVAGFVSYEAAPGLDRALCTHDGVGSVPLIWLGVYDAAVPLDHLPLPGGDGYRLGPWVCDTGEAEYGEAIRRIREYIFAGDTYQVNFTVRLHSRFEGEPLALFRQLVRVQKARQAVYVDTGRIVVCSASPELFFERDGLRIRSRPMKGTSARGLSFDEDRRMVDELRASSKNQAENVMIVDMIRNDLGRIAEPGSVHVSGLFEVEQYPTVHQMVSTVEARTGADLSRTVGALFPCASITGAPKVRTMQIIRELERSPRGVYTGMCGYWLADGHARFNVAIRTVVVDRETGRAEYGTGGGIVWDSTREGEYRECFTKAAILERPPIPDFRILETLLYESPTGWFLVEEHIRRAARTAAYFGFRFDAAAMRLALDACVAAHAGGGRLMKVRWLLAEDGRMETGAVALDGGGEVWKTGVAMDACRRDDVFVYHKTTCRHVYEEALARFPGCRDVILVNDQGHVTESCYANVVLDLDGALVTPPLACGLLDGVFRRYLLERGMLFERCVTPAMLRRADRVWLINSVRKWIPVELYLPVDGLGGTGASGHSVGVVKNG